jgi:hypothetical protein
MKKNNIDFGKHVQIVKLIRTTLTPTNSGPVMFIEQYWDLNGNLVFEIDKNKQYKEINE